MSIKQKEFHHHDVLGWFFQIYSIQLHIINDAMLQTFFSKYPPKLDLKQTIKITQWYIKTFPCKIMKMVSFPSC